MPCSVCTAPQLLADDTEAEARGSEARGESKGKQRGMERKGKCGGREASEWKEEEESNRVGK